MNTITIDLDTLTAAELAILSKLRIAPSDRDICAETCKANCGPETTRKMQGLALKAIDEISMID